MSELEDLRVENDALRAKIERLTEGSAWKRRIAEFLFQAEADGSIGQVVDQQIRFRMQDLQRTEDRYIEVSEALGQANLVVKDVKVFVHDAGTLTPLDEVVRARVCERSHPEPGGGGTISRMNQEDGPVRAEPQPRFLTLHDVAVYLNVSEAQAYVLVCSGELPAIKVGGRGVWRIDRQSIVSRRMPQ